jgi:predicted aspartyl protease
MPLVMADGSPIRVAVYEAIVVWNGKERSVPVHRTHGDALLGMSLLYGSRLLLDVIDGGQVAIGDLP